MRVDRLGRRVDVRAGGDVRERESPLAGHVHGGVPNHDISVSDRHHRGGNPVPSHRHAAVVKGRAVRGACDLWWFDGSVASRGRSVIAEDDIVDLGPRLAALQLIKRDGCARAADHRCKSLDPPALAQLGVVRVVEGKLLGLVVQGRAQPLDRRAAINIARHGEAECVVVPSSGGCPRSRRTLNGGSPALSAPLRSVRGANQVREDRRNRHEEGTGHRGRHRPGGVGVSAPSANPGGAR